jgi:opacity protein-like surface antigen
MKKAIVCLFLGLMLWMAGFSFGADRVRVTVDKANVRAVADRAATVVRIVSRDEVFTVLEKTGPWYKIVLPVDNAADVQSGFINEIVVAVLKPGAEAETAKPAKVNRAEAEVRQARESEVPRTVKAPARNRLEPEEKLFSGLSLKFGLMTFPKGGSFGDKWILGLGYDKGLNRYLSVGLELQPYLRSYSNSGTPDASLTVMAAHAFLNVKAGANMGQFVPFLKFWKPFVGVGAGGAFVSQKVKYKTLSDSKFNAYFAWHWMIGSEFAVKGIDLILEYQSIMVSVPEVDPDSFSHCLMFGVRF